MLPHLKLHLKLQLQLELAINEGCTDFTTIAACAYVGISQLQPYLLSHLLLPTIVSLGTKYQILGDIEVNHLFIRPAPLAP